MQHRVKLKDVAEAAGVHISTVSRALDPNSKTPLTKDVEQRIKAVANKLGYRPNRIAAGLRTNRSMSIGIMIPDITNTLFPPFVRGIESILEPLGYASILVNTDNIPEREARLLEVLRERGVDGIISVAAQRDDPEIAKIVTQGMPVVTLNRRLDRSAVPFVINDETGGINLALQHLFDLGHRYIGHIAGPENLSTGQNRADAFISGCKRLGIDIPSGYIAFSKNYDEAEGECRAVEILSKYPEVTALLCANDRLAIGAYSGIRSLGLKVPDDVSVTGFNDSPMLELIPPRLTTIRIQQFDAGRAAAELILKSIRGELNGSIGTVLPVTLIKRDSTRPPRAGA